MRTYLLNYLTLKFAWVNEVPYLIWQALQRNYTYMFSCKSTINGFCCKWFVGCIILAHA